jgi:hypothetical protein
MKKFKGTKDSVCNECYDNGFKGSPCPHIDVQQHQDDIKAGVQVGETEVRDSMCEYWYQRGKDETISRIKAVGATCDDVDLVTVAKILNKLTLDI